MPRDGRYGIERSEPSEFRTDFKSGLEAQGRGELVRATQRYHPDGIVRPIHVQLPMPAGIALRVDRVAPNQRPGGLRGGRPAELFAGQAREDGIGEPSPAWGQGSPMPSFPFLAVG
jgi:hypothetical protein